MCSGRLDGHPAEVGRGAHRHAPEADVHRRLARVEERLQLVRERALIRQDPGPRLDDVEISQILPWGEERIRGQPDLVREDVVADVLDRGLSDRGTVPVEGRCAAR
jgi:hypothetical protein